MAEQSSWMDFIWGFLSSGSNNTRTQTTTPSSSSSASNSLSENIPLIVEEEEEEQQYLEEEEKEIVPTSDTDFVRIAYVLDKQMKSKFEFRNDFCMVRSGYTMLEFAYDSEETIRDKYFPGMNSGIKDALREWLVYAYRNKSTFCDGMDKKMFVKEYDEKKYQLTLQYTHKNKFETIEKLNAFMNYIGHDGTVHAAFIVKLFRVGDLKGPESWIAFSPNKGDTRNEFNFYRKMCELLTSNFGNCRETMGEHVSPFLIRQRAEGNYDLFSETFEFRADKWEEDEPSVQVRYYILPVWACVGLKDLATKKIRSLISDNMEPTSTYSRFRDYFRHTLELPFTDEANERNNAGNYMIHAVTKEQLERAISTGKDIDGSYLIRCVDMGKVEVDSDAQKFGSDGKQKKEEKQRDVGKPKPSRKRKRGDPFY